MVRFVLFLTLLLSGADCRAQEPTLATLFNFERPQKADSLPAGWSGGPKGTIFADETVVHGGHWSARIERDESSPEKFSTLTTFLPVDFAGKSVTLRGWLRLENVATQTGLWLREDGDAGSLAFDNMQKQQLKGTTDWQEYSITLPLNPEAKSLVFGALLLSTGKIWVDDLQLLVDGKPVWEAPKAERPKTPLDLDHEFDGGSKVTIDTLSEVQIANLAMLAKVWGFLKYHHPAITSGTRHWDYDLLRVLPSVLAADRPAAQSLMVKWIDGLGEVAPCNPCATLDPKDLVIRPDIAWISDTKALGAELSSRLSAIHKNRLPRKQFYVSFGRGAQNPVFEHEPNYSNLRLPDAGVQLLTLFRYWNIIRYWSPNREIMDNNWDAVLAEFIPKIALAKTTSDYKLQTVALIARVNDTHANLWGSLDVRPPVGACSVTAQVRFVEGQVFVTQGGPVLKTGDVIEQLDGVSIAQRLKDWAPYYADSNQAARLRDVERTLLRGDCSQPAALRVRRGSETMPLTADRVAIVPQTSMITHDLPGAGARLLNDDIAYVKVDDLKDVDFAKFMRSVEHSKGLIIDIRNYPNAMSMFTLGTYLVTQKTDFARFTRGDLSNPGAFHWGETASYAPQSPHYSGKIVILVDEVTQSSAEYHAMAFRAVPGAVVIGSTTAGADGNVSAVALPGGLRTMISGIGVFYPDGRPTQRIGIVPDKEVKPTIAGMQAGRDEVLESALREILGPDRSIPDTRKWVQP